MNTTEALRFRKRDVPARKTEQNRVSFPPTTGQYFPSVFSRERPVLAVFEIVPCENL